MITTDQPEQKQFQLKWRSIAIVCMMLCVSVLGTAYAVGSGDGGNSIPVVIESGSGVETASYIIYKDGDYICAKNGTTGRIESRADLKTAVEYASNHTKNGTIAFTAGIYHASESIYLNPGVFLRGNGAEINMSLLTTGALFSWGNDLVYETEKITGMSEFFIHGNWAIDYTSHDSWVANVSNIKRSVVFEKISMAYLPNGIMVRGACYDAALRDIRADEIVRDVIHLYGYQNGAFTYSPNGAVIDHLELSTTYSTTCTVINNTGGQYSGYGIKIINSYFEGALLDIDNSGDNCAISNNAFFGTNASISNTRIRLGTTAGGTTISGNVIYVASSSSVGIDILHSGNTATITGNDFRTVRGKAIYSHGVASNYLTITGNTFQNAAITGIGIAGTIDTSAITGNNFQGTAAGYGEGANVTANYVTFSGNSFYYLAKGLSLAGNKLLITGNSFSTCTCSIFGPSLLITALISDNYFTSAPFNVRFSVIVANNQGYLTENSGSATILSGTNVVVNHGLSATPSIVLITMRTNANVYYWVSSIGATTFTININTTNTVYFYWYAKV